MKISVFIIRFVFVVAVFLSPSGAVFADELGQEKAFDSQADGHGGGAARDSVQGYFGRGYMRLSSDGVPLECVEMLHEMDRPPVGRLGEEPKQVRFASDEGFRGWQNPVVALVADVARLRVSDPEFNLETYLREQAFSLERRFHRKDKLISESGILRRSYGRPTPQTLIRMNPTSDQERIILHELLIPILMDVLEEENAFVGPPQFYIEKFKYQGLVNRLSTRVGMPTMWVKTVAVWIADEFWK